MARILKGGVKSHKKRDEEVKREVDDYGPEVARGVGGVIFSPITFWIKLNQVIS